MMNSLVGPNTDENILGHVSTLNRISIEPSSLEHTRIGARADTLGDEHSNSLFQPPIYSSDIAVS